MTESGLKLILWVTGASLVGAMLAMPQPVDPWEMPSLVLERAAAADAIGLDESLAAEAPQSEEARALRSLFLDHGRSEANPPYERNVYDQRQSKIYHATAALIDEHGPSGFAALRAEAVEEFMRVLADAGYEPRDDYEAGVLGGAVSILEQYGAIYEGVLVAPEITARVFYKARWNSIHRRPFTESFSPIELQAYWGWLALHGWGKPLAQREDALVAFRDAGGSGSQEAAALFDLLEGRPDRAAKSLEQLYEETGELRLRNLALGTMHTSLSPPGAP